MKIKYVKGNNSLPFKVARAVRRGIRILILVSLLLLLVISVLMIYRVFPVIKGYYNDSEEIAAASKPEDFKNLQTGYIYDKDGIELLRVRGDKDIVYLEYKNIPQNVVKALVAIEDRRFFEHSGVDWLSTGKAAVLLLQHRGEITRGGSTITQQLARNVYLSFTTSYERKIREIFLALDLEKVYSKEQILEYYINNINFGNSYYGIGAAAKGYFGKSISKASLSEIAFLCGIPNNPSYYDPRVHYEHTLERRDIILKCMLEQGLIGDSEYQEALKAVIVVKRKNSGIENDYAASFALDCTIREFMVMDGFNFEHSWDTESGYEAYLEQYNEAYANAKEKFKKGGYKVYTSLSNSLQDSLQQVFEEELSGFEEKDKNGNFVVQGAATVVDNDTGLVVGVIGGRGEDATVLGLNRAYQGYKQPGSCIKPLIVYLPALEAGYSAKSIVSDSPLADGPSNSDGRFLGNITLREAVEKSRNVVAWRLFEEITPRFGLQRMVGMDFSRIVPADYGPAASLGGLTYGVTTVEMAGAYAAIENKGVWREPTCITDIVDAAGNSIYQQTPPRKIYNRQAAIQMTDILIGVTKHGTAARLSLNDGHEAACKTGTINDNKAAWFCGFTHYYTVSTYVGTDDYQTVTEGLYGNSYPMKIWKAIQDFMLDGKEPQPLLDESDFEAIDSIASKARTQQSEPQTDPVQQLDMPLDQSQPEFGSLYEGIKPSQEDL